MTALTALMALTALTAPTAPTAPTARTALTAVLNPNLSTIIFPNVSDLKITEVIFQFCSVSDFMIESYFVEISICWFFNYGLFSQKSFEKIFLEPNQVNETFVQSIRTPLVTCPELVRFFVTKNKRFFSSNIFYKFTLSWFQNIIAVRDLKLLSKHPLLLDPSSR